MVLLITLNSTIALISGGRKVGILKVGVFVRILYFLGIRKINTHIHTYHTSSIVIILGFLFFFLNGKTFLGDLHEFASLS